MARTKTIASFPQGGSLEQTVPGRCHCGSASLKRINEPNRARTRYLCRECGISYMVNHASTIESRLKTIGSAFDSMTYGLSFRQSQLRLYADYNKFMAHSTLSDWTKSYLNYVKMFTDDMLCCLEYGNVWGIDETIFDIQGKWGSAERKYDEEMEGLYARRDKYSHDEFKKEWEDIRAKQERSKRQAVKKYLTAIIDTKTRVIIHYMITDKRPNGSEIYTLLRKATYVAGVPKHIVTDCYPAYDLAMKNFNKALRKKGKNKIEHIAARSKDTSTLHLPLGKTDSGVPRHNNRIESAWKKIKQNMGMMTRYAGYNANNMIHYHVLSYNFIRPHSGLGKGRNSSLRFDMTPAMAGGYPKWFHNFEALLKESWSYDKSFVFKMGDMLKDVRVGIREGKIVRLEAKPGISSERAKELDRLLKVECGFAQEDGRDVWTREIPSIMNMARRRRLSIGGLVPNQTFEVCNRCGKTAFTTPEVAEKIGYRKMGNRLVTQPNCHRCRSILSKNPRQRRGRNRRRSRWRQILLGRQRTLDG